MIAVALFLGALFCIGMAARSLDDAAPREDRALDALLFLLCLIGILAKRKDSDND